MHVLIIFCPQVFLSECPSACAWPYDCILRVLQICFYCIIRGFNTIAIYISIKIDDDSVFEILNTFLQYDMLQI